MIASTLQPPTSTLHQKNIQKIQKSSATSIFFGVMLGLAVTVLIGCNVPVSRNQEFDTALAKFTPVNTLYGPMGGQSIGATFLSDVGCRTINGQNECPSGSQEW